MQSIGNGSSSAPSLCGVYAGVLVAVNRYLKTFFWRVVLCLTPLVIAGLIVGNAWQHYKPGERGGFKLGVDLVGGTILVYEVDMNKLPDGSTQGPARWPTSWPPPSSAASTPPTSTTSPSGR